MTVIGNHVVDWESRGGLGITWWIGNHVVDWESRGEVGLHSNSYFNMLCPLRVPFSSYHFLKLNSFSIQGQPNLSNSVLGGFWVVFGSFLGAVCILQTAPIFIFHPFVVAGEFSIHDDREPFAFPIFYSRRISRGWFRIT